MKFKVVIADDEPYILEGLKKRVDWSQLGYQIIATASNGPECLEMINMHHPDLIITDIRMPGFTGLELIKNIQGLDEKAEVIIISGYSEFDYAKKALEMGVQSYLLKPISEDELKKSLKILHKILFKKKAQIKEQQLKETARLLEFLKCENISKIEISKILKKTGLKKSTNQFISLVSPHSNIKIESSLSVQKFAFNYELNLFIVEGQNINQNKITKVINNSGNLQKTGISTVAESVYDLGIIIDEAISSYYMTIFTNQITFCFFKTDPEFYITLINKTEIFSLENIKSCNRKFFAALKSYLENPALSPKLFLAFYNKSTINLNDIIISQGLKINLLPQFSSISQIAQTFKSFDSIIRRIQSVTEELSTVDNEEQNSSDPELIIHRTLRFINSKFTSDLSLSNIAEAVQTEPKYLSSIFIKHTGSTILEYIRFKRIEHAKFLLRNSELNMNEIADSCGYADYYYFAKVFKKETGITATQFKNK
ncbi:MAG: response regulator [Spirochaetales bacterium]|uniref:Response regulator n=1 Tax=Candidatus Thalassospirochaeta sargassi TaxID=3119039 RepID=A0AAJ1IEP3_9SPIO|nr:response regulator [Spirochaetales bacterium]